MNRLGIDQISEAVGGRILGPQGPGDGGAVDGVGIDSRTVKEGDLFVALAGDRFDGHDFIAAARQAGAAAALVERPVELPPPQEGQRPFYQIRVRETHAALGRLAAWYRRRLPATVVAITGSNGKTTTKSMVEHILAPSMKVVAAPKSFNNRIGLPLTLLSADSKAEVLVCEIGTNAPGEIAALGRIATPDIGVIVTVGEAHLERLRSLAGVASEKASLLGTLAAGGVGIINGDRSELVAASRAYGCTLIRFGSDPRGDLVIGQLIASARGVRFTVNDADRIELNLLGRHNAVNALAAIAVARRLGLSVAEAGARLADFTPPPMRMQRLEIGPYHVINDAYNANPVSMAMSLEVFSDLPCRDGRKVFICGDMLELGAGSQSYHEHLGQRLAASGVQQLIAVGRFADVVANAARNAGMDASAVLSIPDTDTLLGELSGRVRPGDLVLLKGSRGVGLDRVVTVLQGLVEPANASAPPAERVADKPRRSRKKS